MYNCGPTVYWEQHIGNMMAFIMWDVLVRALRYQGHQVKRVVNLTDVGHMTSDEDWGEDKIEVGARREGMTPIDLANKYIKIFLTDLKRLNIKFPDGSEITDDFRLEDLNKVNLTRATDYITDMIEMIKRMEANGYTYETDQAVYFDISKYPEYSKLSGQILEENQVAVRDEVKIDPKKRHPADFVLWMKATGMYKTHAMKWDSPWGIGFPGWHIECSAMGYAKLGDEIDIHTGGIEHIGVHHPNERAQNFGCFQKEIVKMWVHNEHLQSIKGDKLSKSKGNAYTLTQLIEMGFDPMDFRMFIAVNNYRVPLKFSIEALKNTRNIRLTLLEKLKSLKNDKRGKVIEIYKQKFLDALNDDMNVSVAYAVLNEVLKSKESDEDKLETVLDFDNVFGLHLKEDINKTIDIPSNIIALANQRKQAKLEKNYQKADELRKEILNLGWEVRDTHNGEYELKQV